MPGVSKLPLLVTQPPFAPQIQNLPAPLGVTVPLQRGYMIWARPQKTLYIGGGPLGDGRDMINFLFNPSTVNSDYNVGNATLQAAMMYQVPGDTGNLLAPLQQTVSWSLYFDRTYELNYGGNSSAVNDPAIIGVQADVYQFLQFTGVLAALGGAQATQVFGTPTNGNLGATTGGIMMMMPCYVFFGNALHQLNQNVNSSNFNALGAQLAYYGFINEWSVQYTHWTSSMVPIRAVISVNFTMLPEPTAQVQSAVWRDVQKLSVAPQYVQQPFTPALARKTG